MRELLLVVGSVALISSSRTPRQPAAPLVEATPDKNFFPKFDMRGDVFQVGDIPFSDPVEAQLVWKGFTTQVFRRGRGPAARAGQTVTFHYVAWAGKWRQFESSNEHEKGLMAYRLPERPPATPCWLSGLLGMRVGEQRQVTIPSVQRDHHSPTLAYDIELVSIR